MYERLLTNKKIAGWWKINRKIVRKSCLGLGLVAICLISISIFLAPGLENTTAGCIETTPGGCACVTIYTGKIENISHEYFNLGFRTSRYDPGYPITPFILQSQNFSENDTIVLRIGYVDIHMHTIDSISIVNFSDESNNMPCERIERSIVFDYWGELKSYDIMLQMPISWITEELGSGDFMFKLVVQVRAQATVMNMVNNKWVTKTFYSNQFNIED